MWLIRPPSALFVPNVPMVPVHSPIDLIKWESLAVQSTTHAWLGTAITYAGLPWYVAQSTRLGRTWPVRRSTQAASAEYGTGPGVLGLVRCALAGDREVRPVSSARTWVASVAGSYRMPLAVTVKAAFSALPAARPPGAAPAAGAAA